MGSLHTCMSLCLIRYHSCTSESSGADDTVVLDYGGYLGMSKNPSFCRVNDFAQNAYSVKSRLCTNG